MCCAMNVIHFGKLKCVYVVVDREACLVGGNVKTNNVGSFIFSHEFYRFHALLLGIVPQCAKNNSSINTVFFYSFLRSLIYRPDHLVGGQTLPGMLQG